MSGIERLIVPAVFLLFVGIVVYSTIQLGVVSCYVCVQYRDYKECASASGRTAEAATDAAVIVACSQISSGVTESIACGNSPRTREDCSDGC